MSTIRDVVRALGAREGIEAIILLGRDGLPIDSYIEDGFDTERLAALVPGLVSACDQLGEAADRGAFGTSLVEFDRGIALVTGLTDEALLAVLFAPGTNVGHHLYELRRHREAIAGLL
jgi:predicted regulator of Ras-like GTPase activity (Roadblock/LC7/MglB family)